MRIELANQANREMWFFDKKSAEIWPIFVTKESSSGNTVETEHGQILRTGTKRYAIFNSHEMAQIARKTQLQQFDAEYDELLKRNKLRRIKAA